MASQICETCVHKHDRCYWSPSSTCDRYEAVKIVEKKSWEEFRNNGLLWWINMILHTFGWAITYEFDKEGELSNVYPARVKFRGFSEKNNTDGYIKVSQYLKDNVDEIVKEAND